MEVLVTVAFFGTLMFLMALGVMFTGRPLKGSCGGVGNHCPCAETGTPNACKVDLSEGGEDSSQQQLGLVDQTTDGVMLYGQNQD